MLLIVFNIWRELSDCSLLRLFERQRFYSANEMGRQLTICMLSREEFGMMDSGHVLRYYPSIRIGELKKSTEDLKIASNPTEIRKRYVPNRI
jgi:hypothetical protein